MIKCTQFLTKKIYRLETDPFVRGDRARQSEGGTGPGLAIAFRIMEKQGGELAYERVGGENVFWAAMPDDTKKKEAGR